MYALVELHDDKYQPLADLTWNQNKLEYAQLHGYKTFCRTDNFVPNVGMGYQKIHYIKELLETNPDIEWFWWTGTDTMITNFATRIEDRILNAYHFICSVDVNGINADSFLIRNTPKGREYIDRLLELEPECSKHWDAEQRAIAVSLGLPVTAEKRFWDDIEICKEWQEYVKLMPQRYMNSFNYQLYGNTYTDHRDSFGWDGNWQLGDWLIHWPAIPLNYRLDLAAFYSEHIIK
jgi:hypothetical protein